MLNAQERRLPKNANGESIAKDTTKEEKARDKRKGEFFRQLIRFYDKVQSTPAIWTSPDLEGTRDFVKFLVENQDKYPLESEVSLECLIPSANERFDFAQVKSKLTPGFVESITAKSWSCDNGVECPVVQVLYTHRGRFHSYNTGHDKVKIVSLTVVDQDGHRLLARVATHTSNRNGGALGRRTPAAAAHIQ